MEKTNTNTTMSLEEKIAPEAKEVVVELKLVKSVDCAALEGMVSLITKTDQGCWLILFTFRPGGEVSLINNGLKNRICAKGLLVDLYPKDQPTKWILCEEEVSYESKNHS